MESRCLSANSCGIPFYDVARLTIVLPFSEWNLPHSASFKLPIEIVWSSNGEKRQMKALAMRKKSLDVVQGKLMAPGSEYDGKYLLFHRSED